MLVEEAETAIKLLRSKILEAKEIENRMSSVGAKC